MSNPKYDNVFVIFTPGTGGNHLANLLSLDTRYAKRFDYSDYDSTPNNNKDAHYATMHGGPENLNLHYPDVDFDKIKNQKNIFCGHVLEYMSLKRYTDLLDQLPNKAFVNIQIPTPGDPAHTRMTWRYGKMDNYMLGELGILYEAPVLKKIFDLPEEVLFHYVWPRDLFSDNVKPVLDSIRTRFRLEIDLEVAQQLHTKWLSNLKRNKQL